MATSRSRYDSRSSTWFWQVWRLLNPDGPLTRKETFDIASFKRLLSDLGDGGSELARELLDTYLADAQSGVERINAAVQSGDHAAAGEAAHALKSSSAWLGVLRMAELCSELESATSGDAREFAALADEVSTEYERAVVAIDGACANA